MEQPKTYRRELSITNIVMSRPEDMEYPIFRALRKEQNRHLRWYLNGERAGMNNPNKPGLRLSQPFVRHVQRVFNKNQNKVITIKHY